MSTPIFHVDAFTNQLFRGNPAGVCLPDRIVSDAWMQGIASDMNLSETAFLRREEDRFAIRYFTPGIEVPLCGHATLSSAHILWEVGIVPPGETIRFSAKGGSLEAAREGDWIRLDFPTLPATEAEIPTGLGDALGAVPRSVSRLRNHGYLAELDSAKTVRELRPDFTKIAKGAFGEVIVTARSDDPSCDFVSRFFAPGIDIDEDPVTGVAHCTLTPYWSTRLGKTEMVGHQVSKRGGIVRVRDRGERTQILGQALTVMRGEVLV
jgi:PhzF family phenazine biosynthesis protein